MRLSKSDRERVGSLNLESVSKQTLVIHLNKLIMGQSFLSLHYTRTIFFICLLVIAHTCDLVSERRRLLTENRLILSIISFTLFFPFYDAYLWAIFFVYRILGILGILIFSKSFENILKIQIFLLNADHLIRENHV